MLLHGMHAIWPLYDHDLAIGAMAQVGISVAWIPC